MGVAEMNEERAATLRAIDRKIEGLRAREKGQIESDATYARQCFEAFRSEVENGLHIP
jgi:hypothetical protein